MRLVLALDSGSVEFTGPRSSGPFPWLLSVGTLRLTARAGTASGLGVGETSSLAVAIDNAGKQAAEVVGVPLRRVATVYDDADDVLFAGSVESVKVGRSLVLTIAGGGGARLLSEPIPLRSTRDLADFAEDSPLPHRYGDLRSARFPLIRLSATEFLAADHPMEVDAVFVDDESTDAWEQAFDSDEAGNTWTVVRFAAPIAANQDVSATGTGKRSPITGALIENAGEIMADVAAIAGVDLDFADLRAQSAAEGVRLAGSVADVRSVRAVLDEIAQSAGAIWTPSGGRLYPAEAPTAVRELDRFEAGVVDDPVAEVEDSADVLRIAYDRADATGKALHALELAASPRLFGGLVAEIALPWVRQPADAEAIGRRILGRMAAERYAVSFNVARHDLRPGDFVRLVDSPEWHLPGGDPTAVVLGVEIAADAGASRIFGEVVRSTPSIAVTSYSAALPDTSEGGVDVAFRNGVATFTVRDEDGRPVGGARVTLDGSEPRSTDDRGVVSFSTTQGPHELLVEVPGYATQRVEFEL